MAVPFAFALTVCQRSVYRFLKSRPLLCFAKPSNPHIGGVLVHIDGFSTAAVDKIKANEFSPTASSLLRGRRQNKFEHAVVRRLNCSVWHSRGELAETGSLRYLRSCYWMVQTRSFKTKRSGSQTPTTSDEMTHEVEGTHFRPPADSSLSESSAWMLRFSNDNSYASFMRNAYLSVIVAFTVLLDETPVIFAREVSMLFVIMGFTQIVYGTVGFMYGTVHMRRPMHMSRTTALGICTMAFVHVLLWIVAVTIFLGVGGDNGDITYDYQDIDGTNNKVKKV